MEEKEKWLACDQCDQWVVAAQDGIEGAELGAGGEDVAQNGIVPLELAGGDAEGRQEQRPVVKMSAS